LSREALALKAYGLLNLGTLKFLKVLAVDEGDFQNGDSLDL
jgi:hypothetical protein